jgi:hypothetical protein
MTVEELLTALPKKIKVGTLTYSIVIVPDLKDEHGERCAGLCSYEKQTVELEAEAPSCEFAVDTLIHELCHAMWSERKLKKRADEETVVEAFGTALVALFQDNPKLINWIKKGLTDRKKGLK